MIIIITTTYIYIYIYIYIGLDYSVTSNRILFCYPSALIDARSILHAPWLSMWHETENKPIHFPPPPLWFHPPLAPPPAPTRRRPPGPASLLPRAANFAPASTCRWSRPSASTVPPARLPAAPTGAPPPFFHRAAWPTSPLHPPCCRPAHNLLVAGHVAAPCPTS